MVSSRGRWVPRGVKRKMSNYPLRPRAPQPTTRIDFTTAIQIVKSTVLDLVLCQPCADMFRADLLPHDMVAGGGGGEAVSGDIDGAGA